MSSYLLSILVEAKDEASSVLGGIGGAIAGVGKIGLAVAGAGVAALGGALVAAVGNAIDAQDVFAQTEAVIKSTGGAAGMSAKDMADLASSLSAAAGASKFGDEAILQGQNLLATFTNIGKDVFPQATKTMVDMAQAMGTDVKGGAIQLGKALNDPVAGISALSRVGVTFTDEQKKVIASLVKTGDVAGAQKVILAELAKEFGGSAAAAAQTFSGQLGTLKDKFGELLEGIGTKLLPILTTFVGFLNSPEVQAGVQAFADGLVNGIGQAATAIGPILAGLGPILAGAFQLFTTQILPALLSGWQQLQAGVTVLAAIFGGEWTQATTNAYAALSSLFGQDTVNAVLGAIGTIRDTLSGLATTFSDSKNPVEGFLNVLAKISPTFALVKAGIDAALPPIQTIITTVFGIIGGFITEHGAKIQSDLSGAWSQIQAIVNAVVPAIQLIISTVFSVVASFLQEHGAEISTFMATTWDTIAQIIDLALQLIQATVVPAVKAIAGFISAHGTEIKAILAAAWDAIRIVVSTVLGVIKGLLTVALAVIKGDWQGAWDAIKGIAQTVWNGISAYFKVQFDAYTALFKSTWEGIKAFFQGILDGMVGWVYQTFQGILNAIRGFGGQARAAAGSVADAIVGGISSGISDGAGKIISAAKDAAMAALNAAKSALGISSPSKLFREAIGQNAGQSFALGMTDTIPDVTRAAGNLGLAAAQGAQQVIHNTRVLNYHGIHHDEQDVRQALRADALMGGFAQ